MLRLIIPSIGNIFNFCFEIQERASVINNDAGRVRYCTGDIQILSGTNGKLLFEEVSIERSFKFKNVYFFINFKCMIKREYTD